MKKKKFNIHATMTVEVIACVEAVSEAHARSIADMDPNSIDWHVCGEYMLESIDRAGEVE